MSTDISYLLYWDEDTIPITGNMTLGNHLENDLMVPGEDVSDYHARLDLDERGPVIIPLGNATVSVNGRETDLPVQLMLGDTVGIGQATIAVGVEREQEPDADVWSLHAVNGLNEYPVAGEVTIGRASTCGISLREDHISRLHARLLEKDKVVWLQDLNSSNGTRVNNVPLRGGARLFHGDTISFDRVEYQLIGSGGDLTPIAQIQEPLRGTTSAPPPMSAETTQFSTGDDPELVYDKAQMPHLEDTGAFLLGISESVDGLVFRVGVGDSLIGRGAHCEIALSDPTVSNEHAQIKLRPEGVSITNLMSTNGTKINGEKITTANLADGDVVRLGKVTLMYKDVPAASIDEYPGLRRLSTWMLIGAGVAGVALLVGLLL